VVANLLVEAHCTCENASKSEYYFLSEESYSSHVNQAPVSEVLDSKSKQYVGNSAECLQMSSNGASCQSIHTTNCVVHSRHVHLAHV